MPRSEVPEAEALLGQEIKVLDHGFVRLIDYMGGDARIVQSARVSYGEGTKTLREDKGLIHYLYRNAHTSPFEQVQLSFHCKLPIFVARQWIRHRTARLNEYSGRYSVMRDEFYIPALDLIRRQSTDNKQGRAQPRPGEQQLLVDLGVHNSKAVSPKLQKKLDAAEGSVPVSVANSLKDILVTGQRRAYAEYTEMLEAGVARELARINLPLSLYTEWYWQIDLHNLFHFLRLRLDPHAQYEIRVYAEALAVCAKAVAPLAYEAFEEYGLHGASFSRTEMKLLRAMLRAGGFGLDGGAALRSSDPASLTPEQIPGAPKLNERRREEFVKKLWGAETGTETPDFKPVERGE
jgi:thymidylate synthase (FAD)